MHVEPWDRISGCFLDLVFTAGDQSGTTRKCPWGSIFSLNQHDEKGLREGERWEVKKEKENNVIMYYNLSTISNMLPLPINRPTHVVGRLFQYNVTLVEIEHLVCPCGSVLSALS